MVKTGKKKASKPRKGGARKRGAGNGGKGGPLIRTRGNLVPAVCSIFDPFCPQAAGAKWPDGTIYKTLTYQNRFTVTVTTGAGGAAVIWVVPGLAFNYATNSPAAGTVTWPSTMSLGGTSPANWQFGRVVSAGVKVIPTASMTNTSGYFVVTEIMEFAAGGASSSVGAMSDVEMYTQPASGGEFCWVSRAGPLGHTFRRLDANTTYQTDTADRSCLMVTLVGGPASVAAFAAEVTVNWEYYFTAQDAMNLAATPSPPANTFLTRASESVQNAVGSFVKGNQDQFGRVVEMAAGRVLRAGGNAIAGYLTGGASQLLLGM